MSKNKKGVIFVIGLVLLLVYMGGKNAVAYNYEEHYKDSIVTTNAEINARLGNTNLNTFIWDSLVIGRLSSDSVVKLVLRLTDSQCDMCIDMQYLLLDKCMRDMKRQMIVMGTPSRQNNYKGRKLVNDIIEVPDSLLLWEPEFYNTPYYFLLHQDLTVSHFFVPDKYHEGLTESYLEEVRYIMKEEKNRKHEN